MVQFETTSGRSPTRCFFVGCQVLVVNYFAVVFCILFMRMDGVSG